MEKKSWEVVSKEWNGDKWEVGRKIVYSKHVSVVDCCLTFTDYDPSKRLNTVAIFSDWDYVELVGNSCCGPEYHDTKGEYLQP